MDFSEKLRLLMKLTHTTNRQLGELLGLHPSQISRMRSGARQQPGNVRYITQMSDYFARSLQEGYQLAALAEIMKRPALQTPADPRVLSSALLEWLLALPPGRGSPDSAFSADAEPLPLRTDAAGEELHVYFGAEGKRAAVRAFLEEVLRSGAPLRLDVSSDEPGEWMTPEFLDELRRRFPRLRAQGCTCRRIVGPAADLDRSYTALTALWLPYYLSGHVSSCYYPRLRDGLYRRTLLVAPGRAAVFSGSTGQHTGDVTFFCRAPRVVEAMEAEYAAHLRLCAPHLHHGVSVRTPNLFCAAFEEFWQIPVPCFQLSAGLSAVTTPPKLLWRLQSPEHAVFRERFKQQAAQFEAQLTVTPCYDLISLAAPGDIRSGAVPLCAAMAFPGPPAVYTAELYQAHLRRILYLVRKYPLYHPILTAPQWEGLRLLAVKEGGPALLMRQADGDSVFQIREQGLLATLGELLRRTVAGDPDDLTLRWETVTRINALLKELDGAE